jgi:Skp family chaperone for outer membrane proteins
VKNLMKSMLMVGAICLAGCANANSGANSMTVPSPVAVVNLNQVFDSVPQGQAAFAELKTQTASQATELQNQQDALNQQLQAYQTEKANLAPDQQSAQAAQLLNQQGAVQKSVADYQTYIQQQQKALLNTFADQMNAAVAQIAKKNGYHLVLSTNGAVYNDGSVDITQQVIQMMKKH